MANKYYVKWDIYRSCFTDGPFPNKITAIRHGRFMVKRSAFLSVGVSGRFQVEAWSGSKKTIVFAETVTHKRDGVFVLNRNRHAEGLEIVEK